MSETFNFNSGQTTFVNRPKNTTIHAFSGSNTYVTVGRELEKLRESARSSAELDDAEKAESVELIARVAGEIEGGAADATKVRPMVERLTTLLGKASELAKPVLEVTAKILQITEG